MQLMVAHNEWAKRPADQRFQSLDALAEAVGKRRLASRESVERLADIRAEVAEDGSLWFRNGRRLRPTNWSFGQTCGLLQAPAAFLGRLKPETAVACLNDRFEATEFRDDMKLMRISLDDGDVLQAVTSTTYGRIWDADVVDGLRRIVERTGGKFRPPAAYEGGKFGAALVPSGLYASDRDMFAFLVDGGDCFDAGPRAQFHRGLIAWNSEVGSRTFGMMTFLFNFVCGNHIIWSASNVKELRIRHTSGGPGRYLNEAVPALLDYTRAVPDLGVIRLAQSQSLLSLPGMGHHEDVDDDWRKEFARTFGFSGVEVREAFESAEREEGGVGSLWNLVQGFTASAREIPHIDYRIDLETRAGKLLELAA